MASYGQGQIPGLTFASTADRNEWSSNKTWTSTRAAPAMATEQQPAQPGQVSSGAVSSDKLAAYQAVEEEGELSEAVFEDLYEPYEEPGDVRAPIPVSDHAPTEDEEEYVPPDVTRDQNVGAAQSLPARERSRSYSPYLSPGEVHTLPVETREQTGRSSQDGNHAPVNRSTSQPPDGPAENQSVAEIKKKAQAAILRLWPLNVRFQDYVDEGIDENIVRDLFQALGLDTKYAKPALDEHLEKMGKPPPQAPLAAAPVRTQAMPQVASSNSEERKDRIARLLAAKAAKPAHPSAPAQPSASATPAPNVTSSKPLLTEEQARAKADKERLLQQKLEALQKSRAARAQKASGKSNTQLEQPPPVRQTPVQTGTTLPAKPSASLAQQDSLIPGLFLSNSSAAASTNVRKRPVAADLNDASPVPPKRPFGQLRNDSSLIIDVSDDSDIEMDLGSPKGVQSPGALPQSRTTSFRNHPPLSDRRGPHQLSSPGPQSGPLLTAKPPSDPAKLDLLHQDINEMKRKIAEAERRKIAKQAVQSPAATSSAGESSHEKPELRRAKSMGSLGPSGPDDAPTPASTSDAQRKLPKPSRMRASTGGVNTEGRRLRIVSEALPNLEANLTGKKAKLRLLMSEQSRLQKEIDDMEAEKAVLEREAQDLATGNEESASGACNNDSSDEATSVVCESRDVSAPPSKAGAEQQRVEDSDGTRSDAERSTEPGTGAADHAMPSVNDRPGSGAASPASEREEVVSLVHTGPSSEGEADGEASDQDATMADAADDSDSSPTESSDGDGDSGQSCGGAGVADASAQSFDMQPGGEPSEAQVACPNGQELSEAGIGDSNSAVQEEVSLSEPVVANNPQEATRPSPPLNQISNGVRDTVDQEAGTEEVNEAKPHSTLDGELKQYESLFKGLIWYRFHPDYKAEVAGGLRSLTYSNKIDPHTPFCPESLAGEECPRGAKCDMQHMDTIGLSDSEIILQLGDASKLSGDDYQKYIDGLRAVLSHFRGPQSKDFNLLSRAILDYRAQFFGNKYKILPLGDVKI